MLDIEVRLYYSLYSSVFPDFPEEKQPPHGVSEQEA
jgi:hypothetical protein